MTQPGTDAELGDLRARAVAVAYRMVGSRSDAEDLAQEAMVRVQAALGSGEVRSPTAFTTTVTTRLAIDHLRSARVRRESYVGPWLPEPVSVDPLGDGATASELADSLSFAFLVVLEALGPVERAAFLMHDVFGYGYAEVAEALDRNEPACRQLVVRARRRLGEARRGALIDPSAHHDLVARFVAATRTGDVDGLVSLLARDAVMVSDGGPTRKAARLPVVGRDRVARFLRHIGPKVLGPNVVDLVLVNGEPGFVVTIEGHLHLVGTVEVHDGAITAVRWVLNPDKLRWVVPPPQDALP